MSRVKFKIWDKTRNKWLTSNCGQFLLNQNGDAVFHQNGDNPLEALIEQIDYEVLLYTGIKDKNGIEIYEGDIVEVIFSGKLRIFQVVFDLSELDFKATNGKEHYGNNFEYLTCCDEVRIIGNIYQNPELLEDVDND